MSYKIETIAQFDKELKSLVKKYPSFKSDFITFISSLKENPIQGTPLGKNCYKIHLAIRDKGRGKSSGARIITNFVIDNATIYLLSIYDKSSKENLTDKQLNQLLMFIQEL